MTDVVITSATRTAIGSYGKGLANRLCGTGVQAIVSATQAIQTGEAGVALAGGAESMSRGPYWMPSARWGARTGEAELIDPVMGALTDPFNDILMGVTAENLAERGSISRERQDAFAVRSHQRAAAARARAALMARSSPCRSTSSARASTSRVTSTSVRTRRPRPWPSCARSSSPTGRSRPETHRA